MVKMYLFVVDAKIQIQETVGAESIELSRYKAKMEERARREEELFIRAPVTKEEKKREKHLKKSRNGYAQFSVQIDFNHLVVYFLSLLFYCFANDWYLTILNFSILGCLV